MLLNCVYYFALLLEPFIFKIVCKSTKKSDLTEKQQNGQH